MSGGYCSWAVRSSIGVAGPSWSSGASWCSSKGDVKCIVDMLWVLMRCASGRVVSSRYKGSRDDLHCCHQGLRRHSEAMVHVSLDRCSLLAVPFSVWASRATWFNNRLCASDLYVDRGCRFVFGIWVNWGGVHVDVVSLVVWLSRCEAVVKLIPLAFGPRYCSWWMSYLPAKIAVPPVIPSVCFANK